MTKFYRVALLSLSLAACATEKDERSLAGKLVPGDPSAPSQVKPSEALAIADRYCKHAWQPFARNILHGPDARGVVVDTPDAGYRPANGRNGWWLPGEVNVGIPYKWGGFDDPAAFDEGVAQGAAAGDVSSPEKRALDNAAVSAQSVGVDCSGLVSRCLKLPTVYDTTQLPSVCNVLPAATEMRPGDILLIPRHHVLLFAGWARKDRSWIFYYETGAIPEWKPFLKQAPLSRLLALGYKPLRYRGMAYEELPSGKEVLTRSAKSAAIVVPNPVVGEP